MEIIILDGNLFSETSLQEDGWIDNKLVLFC